MLNHEDEVALILDNCGWCGRRHPADDDCGCKPCPYCDEYHDLDCGP